MISGNHKNLTKIEHFDKNRKFLSEIENFYHKSIIFIRNRKFLSEIEVLTKIENFDQKSKILTKIENFDKNRKF